MSNNGPIKCPYCNSLRVQAGRRGFDTKRAMRSGMLTNSWFLAYMAGSSGEDDIEMTCLQCGSTFEPYQKAPGKRLSPIVIIIGILILLMMLAS